MRLLLSNDDGVHAPGILALHQRLARGHEVVRVAPLEERSTTGHSMSLDKPLRLEALGEGVWGCSGFPADCVLMGLAHVCRGNRPDLVVSGINRGANLGQDLYYSGTVAAAREAAFHDVPGVAVSLCFRDFTNPAPHYASAAEVVAWLLEEGLVAALPPRALVNVNVPDLPVAKLKGLRLTHVGFRRYSEDVHARTDSRGRPYYWIAGLYEGFAPDASSDCAAVEDGYVAVTPHDLVGEKRADWGPLRTLVEKTHARHFA